MEIQNPVVFYLSASATAPRVSTSAAQLLAERGFQVVDFHDMYSLSQGMEYTGRPSGKMAAVWLSGRWQEIVALSLQIRLAYPPMGILLQSEWSPIKLTHALLNGADMLVPQEAHIDLLTASLHTIFRRLVPVLSFQSALKVQRWRFEQDGWTLTSPSGQGMSLTSTERNFFACLLASPERRASHVTLLQSLDAMSQQSCSDSYSLVDINRLGVLVSRLRRKSERLNIHLPIRSVHNWGYMFAAECELPTSGQELAVAGQA